MAKTYPFSVRKHAHDIELYHNRLFNTRHDMEMGDIPWDQERYDRICDMLDGPLAELRDMMFSSRDGITVQLTGPQIGLAKQIVLWAGETRAQSCIERGRLDLLKYC